MARVCKLTGKRYQSGNNVSHAHNATRRRFQVNVQNVSLYSNLLKKNFNLSIAASTIRTVDYKGGLDNYLISTANSKLSAEAIRIKKMVKSKQAA